MVFLTCTETLFTDLKSNMDRFIVLRHTYGYCPQSNLKSNMDRFIDNVCTEILSNTDI